MESKTNKMNRNLHLLVLALVGLFGSVIVSSCLHGFQMILEKDSRAQFAEFPIQLHGAVATSIKDGLITMAIKFLHFFTAKWMQFRYLSPLLPPCIFYIPLILVYICSISFFNARRSFSYSL